MTIIPNTIYTAYESIEFLVIERIQFHVYTNGFIVKNATLATCAYLKHNSWVALF